MRATRTPRGSLREAVQLLAQAVGILWLNDRGKPEPPEVLPFTNPARCERRSHCRGSIGVYPRRLQSPRLSALTLLTASRSRSVAPLSKTQTRGTSIPKSRFPFESARCARSRGWHGGMPRLLLISLMRSTPPFWMPASLRMPEPQPDESIVDPPGPKSNFAGPWQTLF